MKVFMISSLLLIGFVSSFSIPKPKDVYRNVAGSLIATSTILSNVIMVPADAMMITTTTDSTVPFESTTQFLAARSGGRAGGRAPARSMSRPSSSPTIIDRRTTVITQPIYGGGGGGMFMSPGYYAPQPSGLGLAIGLNAVSGIADGFREARQENEIRSTRDQLMEARMKEAEMEARLRQLEQQTTNQNNQMMLMQQQQQVAR